MNFQMQKMPSSRPSKLVEGEQNEAPPSLTMVVTRCQSDIAQTQGPQQPRHKSPFPRSRVRSSEDMDREASLPIRSTRKADSANPSEWVLLDRSKSPRSSKISSSSVAMKDESLPVERKSSRSSSRKSKEGMGDANRATRRSHTCPHTRQHEHKDLETISVVAGVSSPLESHNAHQSLPLHQHQQAVPVYQPPPYRVEHNAIATSSPSIPSRRASRGDIIMWRHVPRSAILFGVGSFCNMFSSLVQDMQYSIILVLAFIALFYLAARFIKCNFLRGSTQTFSVGALTEVDVLSLIRVLLPPFNIMLQNLGDLFYGEPMVTLKVAGALWFLVRAGSMMNMWTLARVGW